MDRTMFTKTDFSPSTSHDHSPSPQQSDFSNDFCLSTKTVTVISSGSSDSATCTEMGSPCDSPESISESDRGNSDKTFSDCEPVGRVHSETREGGAACDVETAATKANCDRLHTLFSEYERIIAGDTGFLQESSSLTHGSEARASSFSESQQQPAINEATTVYAPRREGSPRENRRSSQRKVKNTQRATVTGHHRIKKKRISAGRNQEYEFLRLESTRQASNGSIEYKVMWKPTWVAFEDLRGERALEEAEELTVHEFGQFTWERELRRSGYLDVDTETDSVAK